LPVDSSAEFAEISSTWLDQRSRAGSPSATCSKSSRASTPSVTRQKRRNPSWPPQFCTPAAAPRSATARRRGGGDWSSIHRRWSTSAHRKGV